MKKKTRARLARLSDVAPATPNQAGRELLEAALFPRAYEAYVVALTGPLEPVEGKEPKRGKRSDREALPEPPPWFKGEETVHDVRVGTRRLVEALDLTAPLLPLEVRKALRADAKKLRRALGARREADVLIPDFRELVERAGVPGDAAGRVAEALGAAGAEGDAEIERNYPLDRLLRLGARVVASVDALTDIPDQSWRDVGAPHLFDRAAAAEAGLECLTDDDAQDAHHALRLTFKRLRYAAELLASVFPEEIAEIRLRDLKKLQDALGQLQDAGDLLSFLDRDEVRSATDDAGWTRLHELSRAHQMDRLIRAREVADRHARDVIAAASRAAGKIGLFERTPA